MRMDELGWFYKKSFDGIVEGTVNLVHLFRQEAPSTYPFCERWTGLSLKDDGLVYFLLRRYLLGASSSAG